MKLKDYLKLNEISMKDFAYSIHYSYVHINNITNGKSAPSLKLKVAIFDTTHGMVDLWSKEDATFET